MIVNIFAYVAKTLTYIKVSISQYQKSIFFQYFGTLFVICFCMRFIVLRSIDFNNKFSFGTEEVHDI